VTPEQLKDLYERRASAMGRRPALAGGGGHARVRAGEGLRCEVVQADITLPVDLPAEEGGSGSGPHPDQLLRASLGGCLLIGYRIWAARLDIPVDDIELEITCEYDARGQLGLSSQVPVGWTRILVAVTVASRAAPAEIQRLVDHANRLSPMLANLSREIEQVHHLTVRDTAERIVPPLVTPAG
jgi:uncharacterized OsmC-like protein